jgi:hypothetical protein
MIRNGQIYIQRARKSQKTILDAAVLAGIDMEAQGGFSANIELPIVMNDSQKTQFSNEWHTYRERNDNLIKHRGQAFSLIQGQCT